MTDELLAEATTDAPSEWNGYNNVGICAVALMSILAHARRLPLLKTLLVMPLVMHEGTVTFLSKGNVAQRQVAALAASRADLFSNFRQRFQSSLVVTINTIQLLVESGHIQLNNDVTILRPLVLNSKFGSRALKIEKAAKNIAALLESSEEELYLNLRIWL